MRWFLIYLILFSVQSVVFHSAEAQSWGTQSVFQDRIFYLELSKRVKPSIKAEIQTLMEHRFFVETSASRVSLLLKKLEQKKVLDSWYENPEIFKLILQHDLLIRSEEKRYFYMREAFKKSLNATVEPELISSLKMILDSDFLAVVSDMQFRSMLAPLFDNGFMETFFSVIGNLIFLESNEEFKQKWDDKERELKSLGRSEETARISALMSLVENSPDAIREKAVRLRDSGYYEKIYSYRDWLKKDLFQVFVDFFRQGELAKNVQKLMQKNILMFNFERAARDHERYVKRQTAELGVKDSKRLAQFLKTRGFEVFVAPEWSNEIWILWKSGVLHLLGKHMDSLVILASKELEKQYDEVESYLTAQSEKQYHKTKLKKKYKELEETCQKNMSIMMKGRQRYNRIYRETVDLENEAKRKRFLKLLGVQGLHCPDDGEYKSTEYGWIYCTRHGKALIPEYE